MVSEDNHDSFIKISVDKCPLCSVGSLSLVNGAHKCHVCDNDVHALPISSKPV